MCSIQEVIFQISYCARAQSISQCVDARWLNVPTKWSQVVANHMESYKGHT